MVYKKSGFPQEGEVVLCTVTGVHHHSVFASLDEYQNKSGIIHISEVSPGRIRNLRDYVVEGKKVLCKILRVNLERGHIDLSLRRVSEGMKRQKSHELKQEQLAEKIIEFAARDLKTEVKTLYPVIRKAALDLEYVVVYPCLEDIAFGERDVKTLKLDTEVAEVLEKLVKQRIKPPEVEIKGRFTLVTYAAEGVNVLKEACELAKKNGIALKYLGAGKYSVAVKAKEYKEAEDIIEKVVKVVTNFMEKHDGSAEFEREDE
jgi:translation initiation factor 2 subunit 1